VVDNPAGFLTPGMFGHMRLQGSGPYMALLIPDQSIVTDQTRQVVYVLSSNGRLIERDVTTGPLVGGLRVVRQGIGPGDLIVIDGMQRARGGQSVHARQGRITMATPSAADAADTVTEPAGSATIVGAAPAAAPAQ
jgi:hypothetical protein